MARLMTPLMNAMRVARSGLPLAYSAVMSEMTAAGPMLITRDPPSTTYRNPPMKLEYRPY